jgi:hypothetical protein
MKETKNVASLRMDTTAHPLPSLLLVLPLPPFAAVDGEKDGLSGERRHEA